MNNSAYLGQSIKFPIKVSPQGRPELVNGVENVRQAIVQILNTPLGSIFYQPNFGSRVHELLGQPADDYVKSLLESLIREALETWERRIAVQNISFAFLKAEGVINCTIQYTILASNEVDSFVWPFYRNIIR